MLKGKTFLIAGAASGLGESTARLMASLGANVVIGDILDEEATRVAESIISDGGSASTFHLDVRSESDWIDAVHFAVSSHGGLNGLVSNAGISGMIPDVMDTEYFDRLIAIHARGTHRCRRRLRAGHRRVRRLFQARRLQEVRGNRLLNSRQE